MHVWYFSRHFSRIYRGAEKQAAWLQERIAELQSRLDREQADATAAAAALQTVQTHVRSLEQARDALQRRMVAAEEQAQRLQKEVADGKVTPSPPNMKPYMLHSICDLPFSVCASSSPTFKGLE